LLLDQDCPFLDLFSIEWSIKLKIFSKSTKAALRIAASEMPTLLEKLLTELGYSGSEFYRKLGEETDVSVAHLLRDAKRAQVRGSYFIRTAGGESGVKRERPAVHVAEAKTPQEARQIHKQLWNQGTTPFLLVSLPSQVRVYSGFFYEEANEKVGLIQKPLDLTALNLREVAKQLEFLNADSIDSGQIWRTQGKHLTKEKRVDRLLLNTLRSLSRRLMRTHHLDHNVAHALIGRFVYLHYLWERGIISNEWLAEVDIQADSVFSANARLNAFRRVTDRVDDRFNGRIFPIDWSASSAPHADAVKEVARAFAGEEPGSGQMALFRTFDFSFIPIELLSAIYEQFLHDEGKGATEGAFYTSEPVADYLIAEVESVQPLQPDMKVLDACCGSGIFLVLAYRRLIEQQLRKARSSTLPPEELSRILTSSIFGVERIGEACLVTEFSLILTLLDYVKPPELHQHANFRFPELHNQQIFECDFFDDQSKFWKKDERFDWIIGNPPWVEVDPTDKDEDPLVNWVRRKQELGTSPVARFRTSEAFTWRVCERASDRGTVGLITQATSLTNDQSGGYRKAFFTENTVHRVTNFSNLAYVLFESAEEPAANVVYSPSANRSADAEIVHFGPLVVNQPATRPGDGRRRRAPWALTICESEIQTISAAEATQGDATTWKRALWGNPRDRQAWEKLRRIMPTTLGEIANDRGWHLNLGLQLRSDEGSKSEPNQSVEEIKLNQGATELEAKQFKVWYNGLKVLQTPHRIQKTKARLTVSNSWLVRNKWGTYIRVRGGTEGLNIVAAPHLFLWNEFAAFSDQDFIMRHPKLGLAAPKPDSDWLRAVSIIWTSSITPYCLFLNLSAGWGISRSTIDLGDVQRMLMPRLTDENVGPLAQLHRLLGAEEAHVTDRVDWQRRLDEQVAAALKIPTNVMLLAREFSEYRLPLVKGKAPQTLTKKPEDEQLAVYARRLKAELDGFLERKARRHRVTILNAPSGIVATIELANNGSAKAEVISAGPSEEDEVQAILKAAEQQFSQWVYVRRSVRVFAGTKIHLCKPARRLEWTETQALLDAADVIAEVVEVRGTNA
jgi:hypothetical protein